MLSGSESNERGDRDDLAWADVADVASRWPMWAALGGLLIVTVAVTALLDDRSAIGVAAAVVPVTALAVVLGMVLERGELLAAGGLMLAVTPAALGAVAGGSPWGSVAVACACGAVVLAWNRPQPAAAAVIGIVLVGTAAWAVATPDQPSAPGWGDALARTGELAWTSVGAVGSSALVPVTGWLLWWLGVGLLVGCAVIAGDKRSALTIALTTGAMFAVAWALVVWRGGVGMAGGRWLLAGAVAYVGASLRVDRDIRRRVGTAVLVITAYIWVVTIVRLARA
jgi:hypothetical protein